MILKLARFTRGDHTFVFIIDDDPEAMRLLAKTLNEMAEDPELVFGYADGERVLEVFRGQS